MDLLPNINNIDPVFINANDQNINVVVRGYNFLSNNVIFEGVNIADYNYEIIDNNTINIFIVKINNPGKYNISIRNATSVSNTVDFEVVSYISSLSSNNISFAGGDQISINGFGFNQNSKVYLNNTLQILNVNYINSNIIKIDIPTFEIVGSNIANITVETNNVISKNNNASLIKYNPPFISSISNNICDIDVRKLITIHGSYFGKSTVFNSLNNFKVNIDNHDISLNDINYINDTQIEVNLPAFPIITHPGKKQIYVSISNNKSNFINFTYLPVLKSINPSYHIMGNPNQITIIGEGFNPNANVKFGSSKCNSVNFISSSTIIVEPPPSLCPKNVYISITIGEYTCVNKIPFTYISHRIDTISKTFGYINETSLITLTGIGLNGHINCIVGDLEYKIDSSSNTEIVFPIKNQPNDSIGSVDVIVQKKKNSSVALKYVYLTKIIDIVPIRLFVNKIAKVNIKLFGKVNECNLKIKNGELLIVGINVLVKDVNNEILDKCNYLETDTDNDNKLALTYSIVSFNMPISEIVSSGKFFVYIDDHLCDSIDYEYVVANEPICQIREDKCENNSDESDSDDESEKNNCKYKNNTKQKQCKSEKNVENTKRRKKDKHSYQNPYYPPYYPQYPQYPPSYYPQYPQYHPPSYPPPSYYPQYPQYPPPQYPPPQYPPPQYPPPYYQQYPHQYNPYYNSDQTPNKKTNH